MSKKSARTRKTAAPATTVFDIFADDAIPQAKPSGVLYINPVYNPAFCQQLVEHASTGGSVMGFAGYIGTTEAILLKWAGEHEEFAYAMDAAQSKRLAYWESELRENSKNYQPTFIKMILENSRSAQWRTTKALEHEAGVAEKLEIESKTLVGVVDMTPLELAKRLNFKMAALEGAIA